MLRSWPLRASGDIVKPTEYRLQPQGPPGVDPQFQELRAAFHDRLQQDRLRLMVLRTRLAGIQGAATEGYERIRLIAHRMGGAAAVFEAPAALSAANALELAALEAARAGVDNNDVSVKTALDSLINLLTPEKP
jgi:hypothetical protein